MEEDRSEETIDKAEKDRIDLLGWFKGTRIQTTLVGGLELGRISCEEYDSNTHITNFNSFLWFIFYFFNHEVTISKVFNFDLYNHRVPNQHSPYT